MGIIVGSLIMLIAAFTMFAGAIMLLFRIIAIWFLVTISPLVFLCYIMPGLKANWQKWWKTFLNWCIFAPAYAFFIWIAIQIAINGANKDIGTEAAVKGIPVPGVWQGGGANAFVANPGAQLISYFVIIGFLIGGLIVAKNLGIYGANTVMAIGQKWGKGAGNWIKSRATRYPREIGSSILGGTMQQIGRGLKNVPGFGKFGRSLEARGTLAYRKPMEDKMIKDYEKRAELLSNPDLLKDIKERTGAYSLAATQIAMKRELLQKTEDRDAVTTGINMLRGYGFAKDADNLEEMRFSVIEDKQKRLKTIKNIKSKGVENNLRPQAFKGILGQQAAEEFILDEPTVASAVERVKKLRRDAQEQLGVSLFNRFINNGNFGDANNIKLRSAYAGISGNLKAAFWDKQNRRVDKVALGGFVKGMKPENFAGVDKSSIKDIAEFVSAATAFDASRFLSEDKKRTLINEWRTIMLTPGHSKKAEARNTLKDLQKRPAWASLITFRIP